MGCLYNPVDSGGAFTAKKWKDDTPQSFSGVSCLTCKHRTVQLNVAPLMHAILTEAETKAAAAGSGM
eukprot:6266255-Amphidinium_carterae.1